ncbi:MAG: TonB-dependent receptor [Calditrichia bacterium]
MNLYCLKESFKFLAIILIIAYLPLSALAQNTGTVRGVVTDASGEPLVGANIYLEGTTMGSSTDSDGTFVIRNVPSGTYTAVASYLSYKTEREPIDVSAGESITQSFSLSPDALLMDAIVVSGTPGGAGVTKKEASFAITTVEAKEITQMSPSSTADLLKVVPGVWSESSGGVAGANIFVRGLPSAGDAPFVTMSINGGPIYGVETLSFFEQSSIFRIDETIESSEALRGGPSAVFSNAEPGMTVNFNLRKGGEATQGRLKYTTSDYNLQRVDAFMSGKLSEGLYYMAGGYTRTSPGIRNTEFNAENGKQLTLELTKTFKKGVFNAYTRITDDYGQWVLPMALNTGNDLGTFSPLGNANRFRTLQINGAGDARIFDFANGRGWKGMVSGINANLDLGDGWMVRDNLTYTAGDANTYGFVPEGGPVRVSAIKSTLNLDTVRTMQGNILGNSEWVQNYGYWVVQKNLTSINNDLSLSKTLNQHEFTVGLYQARWSSDDFWTLGNHVPVHNVENGDLLESMISAADVASAGGGGPWGYGIQSGGDARVFAIYGADSWQLLPALRIDLGLRHQWLDLEYTLDSGPGYPDGSTDLVKSLNGKDFAFTGAANFDVNEVLGIFGRYSDSYLFPQFDNIREDNYSLTSDGDLETNQFKQFEGGLKYASSLFSFFATGFFNDVDVFDSDIGSVRAPAQINTQTYGVELDGVVSYQDFSLRTVATLQKGEIKDASPEAEDVIGNSIWRQPEWQVRVAPSYRLPLGNFPATIYGAVRSVGERWDSRDNVFQLDGYTKIDAGLSFATPAGLSFGVHGDNLNDSEGLTEGDPRDPTAANGRPIFGRSFNFWVAYDF